MRTGTVLLAAFVGTVLIGCAAHHPLDGGDRQRLQCTGKECTVNVTISATGGVCKPDAIPDLDLRTADSGEKKITWMLATEGYEFSRESYKFGLFIKSDPFDEFKDASVPGNGKTLTIKFEHHVPGRWYEYGVTVRRSTGSKAFCDTLDPWMIS